MTYYTFNKSFFHPETLVRMSTNLLLADGIYPFPGDDSTTMICSTPISAISQLTQPQLAILQASRATNHQLSRRSVRSVETAKSNAHHQEQRGNGILFGITIPLFTIFLFAFILIRLRWILQRGAPKARQMPVKRLGRNVSAGTFIGIGNPQTTVRTELEVLSSDRCQHYHHQLIWRVIQIGMRGRW